MKVIRYTQPGFAEALAALKRHAEPTLEVRATVSEIIANIRARGDAALLEYTERFGGPRMGADGLAVTGRATVDAATKRAISASDRNVFAFAKRSLRKSWKARNAQGAWVGERFEPFERVG